MSRLAQLRFLRALLLTAFVLAAQLLLLQHQADLSQHVDGENCEWCLVHASLAGGLPPAFLAVNLPATRSSAPSVLESSVPSDVTTPAYVSRAPPADLSV